MFPRVAVGAFSVGTAAALLMALTAHASATAATSEHGWCGTDRAADYTAREMANGQYRIHAIYLRPHDAASAFPAAAVGIQADAFAASGLLERLYARAFRFDMGTECGTRFLDISSVRSHLDTAEFADAAGSEAGTLAAVASSLSRAGFSTLRQGQTLAQARRLRTNYVVWLDAPAPSDSCGVAQHYDDARRSWDNWNNMGGKVAVVFRYGGKFCGAPTVRHEIAHALGAVLNEAPNAEPGTGHCVDAFEDTMCGQDAERRGNGSFEDEFFDYGNDDYWDPPKGRPLPWWTVNLSRFICKSATCNEMPSAAAFSS